MAKAKKAAKGPKDLKPAPNNKPAVKKAAPKKKK